MYGNSPKKLLNKIIANKDTKIKVLPLILFALIRVLNSLCKVIMILIHNRFIREGISQYIEGISINPNKVLIQFNLILKLVVGSKELNKFVIIFN
jgi:hypothetical protein